MRVLQQLAKTELVALLALAVVAGLVAGASAVLAATHPSMFTPAGSAQITFVGTLLMGFLPVALLGAPLYVLLSHRRRPAWPTVLLLGTLPGLAIVLDVELGIVSLICGIAIACLTHVLCKRWVSPNNSIKPTC